MAHTGSSVYNLRLEVRVLRIWRWWWGGGPAKQPVNNLVSRVEGWGEQHPCVMV